MTQFAFPNSTVASGSWTPSTNAHLNLDENITASGGNFDFAVSDSVGNNAATTNLDMTLGAVNDPLVSTDHIIRVRWFTASAQSLQGHCELWQGNPASGGTKKAELLSANPISGTEVEESYTLTGTEADSITDYSNLYFRLWGFGTGGGQSRTLNVEGVQFEVPDAGPTGIGNKPIVIGRSASASVLVSGAGSRAIIVGRTGAGTVGPTGIGNKPIVIVGSAAGLVTSPAKLYLRNTVPAGFDTSPRFSSKDSSRGVTPGAVLFEGAGNVQQLSTAIGSGGGSSYTVSTVAGPTAGLLDSNFPSCWMSDVIGADVTISGTISFDLYGVESSMTANATLRVALYRVDEQGALTLIVNTTFGTELGTTKALCSWTASPTSTAMKRGDRILLLCLIDDATALTMATGFTATMSYNGSAGTNDSRITFTEPIAFASAPAGSSYYLRDTASDITNAKVLSTTIGSGTATAVHRTATGPHTFPGLQWTYTVSGTAAEWITPALNAFTLQDLVQVVCYANAARLEDSAVSRACITFELAVINADGSGAVVWARSYTTNDLSTTEPKNYSISGPALSVGQGKRLRFRVYADDYRPTGNMVATQDRTIRYDGSVAAGYASRLIFTQTLTEAPSGPVGDANKPIVLGRTASGTVSVSGSGSKAVLVTGAAAATHPVLGTASKPILISRTAAAVVLVKGDASKPIVLGRSAAGTVVWAVRTGAGAGLVIVSRTAAGGVLVLGTASKVIPLGRTASAGVRVTGTASQPIVIGRSASGVLTYPTITGAGAKAIVVSRTASGGVLVLGAGAQFIVVSRTGAGQVYDPVLVPVIPSPFRRKRFMPHLLR